MVSTGTGSFFISISKNLGIVSYLWIRTEKFIYIFEFVIACPVYTLFGTGVEVGAIGLLVCVYVLFLWSVVAFNFVAFGKIDGNFMQAIQNLKNAKYKNTGWNTLSYILNLPLFTIHSSNRSNHIAFKQKPDYNLFWFFSFYTWLETETGKCRISWFSKEVRDGLG